MSIRSCSSVGCSLLSSSCAHALTLSTASPALAAWRAPPGYTNGHRAKLGQLLAQEVKPVALLTICPVKDDAEAYTDRAHGILSVVKRLDILSKGCWSPFDLNLQLSVNSALRW